MCFRGQKDRDNDLEAPTPIGQAGQVQSGGTGQNLQDGPAVSNNKKRNLTPFSKSDRRVHPTIMITPPTQTSLVKVRSWTSSLQRHSTTSPVTATTPTTIASPISPDSQSWPSQLPAHEEHEDIKDGEAYDHKRDEMAGPSTSSD